MFVMVMYSLYSLAFLLAQAVRQLFRGDNFQVGRRLTQNSQGVYNQVCNNNGMFY